MRLINICFSFFMLSLFFGCGKYGYNFEDGYFNGEEVPSDIETDTTMYVADKSLYHRARIYPGLVGDNVPRIKDTVITFDMKYRHITARALKVSVTPPPIFSTGLYAPAGENIRVTVPEGVLGLTLQIGAHMDNLSGKSPLRRDPIIYTVKELFPGDNYIKNLYGGTVWLRTNSSRESPLSLRFAGAVRAPDFILGESDVNEWIREVEATQVPWLEMRSKRAIFTIPRSMIVLYKEEASTADKALEEWNEIYVEDFYKWMGLEENATEIRNAFPELPERGVLDIQPSAGYAHSGNPWVAQMDKHWFSQFVDHNYIINTYEKQDAAWGAFHEVGHNYQQGGTWSWSGLGETTNNLFIFKAANRLNRPIMAMHPSIKSTFQAAIEYAAKPGTKNIITDDEINDAFKLLTPFLQIFNKAKGKNGEEGWDFMPYIYKAARNSSYNFGVDQAKQDFFYRSLCEFTGQDWARFCAAWGIRVSRLAKNEMRQLYPPMDKLVWSYEPWSDTGGDLDLPPKYDIDSEGFTYSSNMETADNDGGGFPALNDGDYTTYWHTCWDGCTIDTELPVTIDMDMQELTNYKGVYYSNRAHPMVNRRIRIYQSDDKNNWTLLGDYKSLPGTQGQRIEIEFDRLHESRYIRFAFPDPNAVGSVHVALGEMGVFYDVEN